MTSIWLVIQPSPKSQSNGLQFCEWSSELCALDVDVDNIVTYLRCWEASALENLATVDRANKHFPLSSCDVSCANESAEREIYEILIYTLF